MSQTITHVPYRRILHGVVLLAIGGFLLLRFVNLGADFPSGITWSGSLYSDEGFYSNGAVRHYLFGQWYLEGDFNPAVNMPVGQLLHRLTFSVLGLGLSSARITYTAFSIGMAVLAAFLVRQRFGNGAATLTALLLATNYVIFAYGRVAMMESTAMCFVLAGLVVAGTRDGQGRLSRFIFAALLISVGILTKTTMILSTPLLAYLAWWHGKDRRESITFVAVSAFVLLVVVGGYCLTAKHLFPEDFAYFSQLNFGARMYQEFGQWLRKTPGALVETKVLGACFVGMAGLLSAAALVVSRRYRRDPLVHILIIHMAIYIAMLSLVWYNPTRYYVPLAVPMAALAAVACVELGRWLKNRPWSRSFMAAVPVMGVCAVALVGSRDIVSYMASPRYTFHDMADGVRQIIQEREGQVSDVVLCGGISDSVALEIGVRAINTELGVRTIDWRIREYRPNYLLIHVDEDVVGVVEAEGGRVTRLASWDVYGNYYGNGQPVQLLHVCWGQTGDG